MFGLTVIQTKRAVWQECSLIPNRCWNAPIWEFPNMHLEPIPHADTSSDYRYPNDPHLNIEMARRETIQLSAPESGILAITLIGDPLGCVQAVRTTMRATTRTTTAAMTTTTTATATAQTAIQVRLQSQTTLSGEWTRSPGLNGPVLAIMKSRQSRLLSHRKMRFSRCSTVGTVI